MSAYLKKRRKFKKQINLNWRIFSLKLCMLMGVSLVILKLFYLQIINGQVYTVLASDQHEIYKKIFPARGNIFVREKSFGSDYKVFPVATNKEYFLVYAQPNLIDNPEDVANQIYPVLFKEEIVQREEELKKELSKKFDSEHIKDEKLKEKDFYNTEDYNLLLKKLQKKDDPYEPLKKKVDQSVWDEIDALSIDGIASVQEDWRYYPDENLGSHILGFVRLEDDKKIGQYGLEGSFNKILTGSQGYLHSESGAKGGGLAFGKIDFIEAKNGSDIYLTIDRTLQLKACEELRLAFDEYGIEEGTIIIMKPKSGAILSMCSYPDFDPNKYNQVDNINIFNNPATLSSYEPGSIFKPITMATAIDLGKITPDTKYYDEGFVKVDKFTIRNVDGKANQWQTMTEVLEKSLNTGVIFVAKQVGNQKFLNYIKDFNFGRTTDIEINESVGNIKSLELLSDIYSFTASFGQGITVTPIQMISAFSAIANDGKLMKPYLVDEIIDDDGSSVKILPTEIRQVISPRTATLLKAMLVSVIDNGHAGQASVKGYYLGGKTGTAQVSDDERGGYSEDNFIHSFIGFGPIDDPQFTILVKLNNPQDVRFSSESAAPIFSRLAEFVLKYYEIAPDR